MTSANTMTSATTATTHAVNEIELTELLTPIPWVAGSDVIDPSLFATNCWLIGGLTGRGKSVAMRTLLRLGAARIPGDEVEEFREACAVSGAVAVGGESAELADQGAVA